MFVVNNSKNLFWFNRLNKNSRKLENSIKKLTSGLRINKAADDAGGLAISEKMRGQISGFNQAQRNIQDGISLLQVAEGGIESLINVVQRLRVLSVEAANDHLTDDDRLLINEEVIQLKKEIDRIIDHTEFNTIKIFKGGKVILEDKEILETYPEIQNFTRGSVEAFNRGTIRSFHRGNQRTYERGETFISNPGNSQTFSGRVVNNNNLFRNFANRQDIHNAPNDEAVGWIDINTVAFSSDRDGNIYMARFDGSDIPTITTSSYTSYHTNPVSGDVLVQNGTNIAVRDADGSNQVDIILNADVTHAFFSPDGSKIVYTGNVNGSQNVFVRNYDSSTNSVGPEILITGGDDYENISQDFLLSNPEIYNLGGTNASIKVYKNLVSSAYEIPYDPTHTNGYDIDVVTNTLTLYGNYRQNSYDRIYILYNTVNGDSPTDNFKDYYLPVPAEVYNLDPTNPSYDPNGPKSIRLYIPQRGWYEIEYNPNPGANSGYTYDSATRRIRIYGDDRPAGNEQVVAYWTRDTGITTDSDGNIQMILPSYPELYNIDNSIDINPAIPYDPNGPISMRVYLYNGGIPLSEIPYDVSQTNGYYYDPTDRKITIYGDYRPDANQDIRVYYATDYPVVLNTLNEENEYVINNAAGELLPVPDTKIVEILEDGVWTRILENSVGEPGSNGYFDVGFDPNKYFSIDYINGILKLHNNARLDPDNNGNGGNIPMVRITYTRASDNYFYLLGPIADYDSSIGASESVMVNGNYIQQQQSGPNGYRIDGSNNNIIVLQGDDIIRVASNVRIEYLVDDPYNPDDGNAFLLPDEFIDYGISGSEVLRLTGETLGGVVNNQVLIRGNDYIIDPTNNRRIILQGDMRLVQNNGASPGLHGHHITIEYVADDPSNPNDGNTFLLPSNVETSYQTERVYLTGQTIGTGLSSTLNHQLLIPGVDYIISGDRITLIGDARLLGNNNGSGHELEIEYLRENGNVFSLNAIPLEYEPALNGSEVVTLSGETIGGTVNNQALVEGLDYVISGNTLTLINDARLLGGGSHNLTVRYVTNGENYFEIEPNLPDEDIKINSEKFLNMMINITQWDGTVKIIQVTDENGNQVDPDLNIQLYNPSHRYIELINSNRLIGGPNKIEISYDYSLVFQRYITLPKHFKIHIGANENQILDIKFDKLSLKNLGLDMYDVKNRENAEKSITIVDKALEKLNSIRMDIGGWVNTLTYALDYVSIEYLGISKSESSIRDMDMMDEIKQFTIYNLLVNAGEALYNHVNINKQLILSLIK